MKKFTLITAIVLMENLLFAQAINRQDNFPSNQQGINTAKSFQLTEQTKQPSSSAYLDSVIQAKMEIGHLPGVSACIIKGGQVKWEGVYGDANIALNIPVNTATLFMLASVSKTITVTALMQLWEDGLFELDDDINDYTPFEIRNPNLPEEPITFKMLCTHTSSIRDNWSLMPYYWNGDSPIPLDEYLFDYLNPEGANYISYLNYYDEIPGTNLHYSNIGVALMGYLVELIGDSTFSYQTQERIFEPLQMNETTWFVSELDTMHIAMPYFWNGSAYTAYGHYGYSAYPCGQLRTGIDQLTNFLLCYHNGGTYLGQQILQSSTVEMILTPQIPQINPDIGLIWKKYTLGAREILGHYGGDDGVMTCMHFCLEENSAVIIFANREDVIGYQIQELLFDYAADSIKIQCLPEGITFSTQQEIDNFQINHPGCTEIEGDVIIEGNNITNLNGLNVLTTVFGNLSIGDYLGNPVLSDITGLENLNMTGGNLKIMWNVNLPDLSGLVGLSSIGGDLIISTNDDLINLSGLENVSFIGGTINIAFNNSLKSIETLSNVTSLGRGDLLIRYNDSLISLTGLENLTEVAGYVDISGNGAETLAGLNNLITIGGHLEIGHSALTSISELGNLLSIGDLLCIEDNNNLTSLAGLENIEANTIGDLTIIGNDILTSCEVQSLCNYLQSPSGTVNICNNAAGCDNPVEIASNCGNILPCLPYGNYYFFSQEDIDGFQSNYPGCSELKGFVIVSGNNITNLSGLSMITSISGDFIIYSNNLLTDLAGLDNLSSIGGSLKILNNGLISLNGLGNLSSIGGELRIGDVEDGNPALTSISALENIDAGTITKLYIRNNTSLSSCETQSICDYLSTPNADVFVLNNAPGCNSRQEVEQACIYLQIDDENQVSKLNLTISPNPVSNFANLTITSDYSGLARIEIYNTMGTLSKTWQHNIEQTSQKEFCLNLSDIPAGIYFFRLQLASESIVKKILKVD